nr:PREDICTED: golgin subfamily B member 1-like [Latimeria chalumnae]XP_014351390.1 PREDICTED: golgin subfamily B member 1-like [Latimeria chalumnae]|eukprot:XP_006008233.1 PREDICTED: golgin subfamily B member 1-like [Latimeria chalumnae]
MLSRLSDLAKGVNTVLQELSGDAENGAADAQEDALTPQVAMESSAEVSEDVEERLPQMEQLVVQLKDLIRQKDAELEQKEAALKDEKEQADARLAKLKLQAKAKVASLSKQVEELKKQSSASLSGQQQAGDGEHHAEVQPDPGNQPEPTFVQPVGLF